MVNLLAALKRAKKRTEKNRIFLIFLPIVFISSTLFLFPLISNSSGGPLCITQIDLSNGKWFIKGNMRELTIEVVPNLSRGEQIVAFLLNSTAFVLVMFSYGLKFFDCFYFEDIIMNNAKTFPFVFPSMMSFHPALLFALNYMTRYSPTIPVIVCSYFIGKYIVKPLTKYILFSLRNFLAYLFYSLAKRLELKIS